MKKRITKLLCVLMAALMMFSVPVSAPAFTSGNIFGLGTITHQDRFKNHDIYQGIDVSHHNGTINWAKVKAAGVKFAFLRVGYRGYGAEGNIKRDTMFETYIKAAHAQGIEIGIYFYSQATSVTEAKQEAERTLQWIDPYKSYITLPVAFDYEFAGVSSGRLDSAWRNGKLTKAKMTANAEAYCDTIKAHGYKPMIYASKSFFEDQLNYQQLEKKYSTWLAHYAKSTSYKGNIHVWQFSSKGRVKGIEDDNNGYVDANFMYAEAEYAGIPDQEYTGAPIQPALDITYGFEKLIKDKDYTVTYTDNKEYGVATATVKGLGKYINIINKTLEFHILPKTVKDLKVDSKTTDAIKISWDKTSDADGYQVAYLNYVGNPVVIRTFGKDVRTATLNNAKTAWSYTYCVRAYKKVGDKTYFGAFSDTAEAITKPAAVTGVTTKNRTYNQIFLKWNPVGASEKYFIFRYNETNKRYEYIGCAHGKTAFTVKGLTMDTKYQFIVKASKLDTNGSEMVSPQSEAHGTYTLVPATKLKSIAAKAGKKIKIKWKNVTGIQGYEIMWSTTKDFSSNKKSIEVKAGTTTTTLQAYYAKKKYYVRIRTYTVKNGVKHYSPWSNRLSVKTKK